MGVRRGALRGGALVRAPACQSVAMCSRRAKRRVRQAYIILIMKLIAQWPSTVPEGTAARSAARCALKEGWVGFMAFLITN